jgi:hypothetical protein
MDKLPAGGQIIVVWKDKSRRDNHVNWRPTTSYHSGQPHAVHRPRHIDIRKNGTNIVATLKDAHRVMGVAGFHDRKSGVFKHLYSPHPNDGLVLNNQNNCLWRHVFRTLSTAGAERLKIVWDFAGLTTPGHGFRVRRWAAGPRTLQRGFPGSRMRKEKGPVFRSGLLKLGSDGDSYLRLPMNRKRKRNRLMKSR